MILAMKTVSHSSLFLTVIDSFVNSGGLFELSGGYICKLRWQRTKGALLREPGKEMKAEDIRDNWGVIVDWKDTEVMNVSGRCLRMGFEVMK